MRPRDVPAARDSLRDTVAAISESHLAHLVQWEAGVFDSDPRMIYVTHDMVELALELAPTIPDDLMVADLAFPSPFGMIVLAHVIEATDAVTGGTMRVRGLLWGPINVKTTVRMTSGLAIGSFLGPDDWPKDIPSVAAEHGIWTTLGRTEWLLDERLGSYAEREPGLYEMPGANLAEITALAESAIEDRRIISALFTLMGQERHVETRTWTPHSKAARRAGKVPEVTIASLRHSTSTSTAGTGTANYSHRFWVQPHFRWQPYGPRNTLRRLQLIPGHVKGPDDKPFIRKDRVWKLAK